LPNDIFAHILILNYIALYNIETLRSHSDVLSLMLRARYLEIIINDKGSILHNLQMWKNTSVSYNSVFYFVPARKERFC